MQPTGVALLRLIPPTGSWQTVLRVLEAESCWDSVGEPCGTEGGKLIMGHTAYKGKSFKQPLNAPRFHLTGNWLVPSKRKPGTELIFVVCSWSIFMVEERQERAGKVVFFTVQLSPQKSKASMNVRSCSCSAPWLRGRI